MLARGLGFALICCLFLGWTPPASAQAASGLDEVLKKSLAAYGGEARLAALKSLSLKGRISAKGQAQPGSVERLFQAPDRLSSLIVHANGSRERRILVRDKAWRNGQAASVPEHLAMSLQLARMRLPLLLQENRATLSDLGEREQNGRRFRTVALAVTEGVSLSVLIDSASGFILQTVGKLSLADGTNADFTTLYADYKMIGGLAVAMREDHYSQGAQTGSTVFEQAETDRALPGNAFTP